jgi:hypothetical protein
MLAAASGDLDQPAARRQPPLQFGQDRPRVALGSRAVAAGVVVHASP